MYKTLKISEELHVKLKKFSLARGHTIVWLLEKIIRDFLESNQTELEKILKED
jgi:predicted transcriptional regulator